MAQTKKGAIARAASTIPPEREAISTLSDEDLAAYAKSLHTLIGVVSPMLESRGLASFESETGNHSNKCDNITSEALTTDSNETLTSKPPRPSYTPRLRKREDLPDPTKPATAEVNLRLKKMNPRVSPEHIDLFNRVAEKFYRKRDALEAAIELLAEKHLDMD